VIGVCYSPDGAHIATGSLDATAKVWRASDGAALRTLCGHASGVFGVAWSPDGATIASTGACAALAVALRRWPPAARRPKYAHALPSLLFYPRARSSRAAGRDYLVKLWRASDGSLLRQWKCGSDEAIAVAFSPSGQTLAAGCFDRAAHLLRVADASELAALEGHSDWCIAIAFSPAGDALATASDDRSIKIWRAAGTAAAAAAAAAAPAPAPSGGLLGAVRGSPAAAASLKG